MVKGSKALSKGKRYETHHMGDDGSKTHSRRGYSEKLIYQGWKQCIMIKMNIYLPEKYWSPSLMEFFFPQKFESLIVSFDGSFCFCFLKSHLLDLFFMEFSFKFLIISFDGFLALAYSSHILWSWPLGRIWHQHTSLPTNLYLNYC